MNNAGIADMRPFAMSTVEGVWRQVEVNFKGVSFSISFELQIPLFTYQDYVELTNFPI